MAKELIIKCGCDDIDCSLKLILSPINSISLINGFGYIGGIKLSNKDTMDLITQLQENLNNLLVIENKQHEFILNLGGTE